MNTELSIKNIMTTNVVTLRPEDSILKLEEVFETLPIHHILVTNNQKLVGIVSKIDLLNLYRKELIDDKTLDRSHILIQNIMTTNPVTIDCDDTIGLAADIFLANTFHSLPVLDGNELIGILTNHDLIKYAYK
ncbi:MAG: CBS domain-containing protein [Saprospiraceae bacterium]